MRTSSFSHTLEVLEARIAPAAVLLQSSAGASKFIYTKDAKMGLPGGIDGAVHDAGADLGVFLGAGDTLYQDSNLNGKYDKGIDTSILAKVTGGRALVLFTDLNKDHTVAADEVTGLRVSDLFEGTVTGTIHGSVVTDLGGTKTIKSIKGKLEIDRLTVGGAIEGDLLVSGAIKKLDVGGTALSVHAIRTGDSTVGISYSLNGSTALIFDGYSADAAGSVSLEGVKLAGGTTLLQAGSGGSIAGVALGQQTTNLSVVAGDGSGAGRAGGSLSNISITGDGGSHVFTFEAGTGADGLGSEKLKEGGAGGSIKNVTVSGLQAGSVQVHAGAGGSGKGGSAGGSISGFSLTGGALDAVELQAGTAQDVSDSFASGGDGGSISGVRLNVTSLGNFEVTAGDGGLGGEKIVSMGKLGFANNNGGDGGSITNVRLMASTGSTEVALHAGNGADAGTTVNGRGGAGGAIGGKDGVLLGFAGDLDVSAGLGGTGYIAGAGGSLNGIALSDVAEGAALSLTAGDSGGGVGMQKDGGSISGFKVATSHAIDSISLTAGASGGAADDSAADGGSGGSIMNSNLAVSSLASLSVQAGSGADGGSKYNRDGDLAGGGHGGQGGSITGFTFSVSDLEADSSNFALSAGAGGSGMAKQGGGAGGSISGLSFAHVNDGSVEAGSGGSSSDSGNGGSGGSIFSVGNFIASGDVTFTAGSGGSGISGGAGGSLGGVGSAGLALTSLAGSFSLVAGDGGDADSLTNDDGDVIAAGAAGSGGTVQGVRLTAANDQVGLSLLSGQGGAGGGSAAAGNGGFIKNITVLAEQGLAVLSIISGDGGAAELDVDSLIGSGGNINGVAITGDPMIASIAGIIAGLGGDGDGGTKFGVVTDVTLNGEALVDESDSTPIASGVHRGPSGMFFF